MPRLVVVVSGEADAPAPSAVPMTGVDVHNNFTINGVPTLLIQAAHCSYFFFCSTATGAGYTEAQAIAKINQMKSAGVICGESGSVAVPSLTPPWNHLSDNAVMFQRHGIYGAGGAGIVTIPPAPEQTFAALQANMRTDLGQPHLLLWSASGETEPGSDVATFQTYLQDHVAQIRQIDPLHPVIYSYGTGTTWRTDFYRWIGSQGLQLPFYEYAYTTTDSLGFILKPFQFFTMMNIGTGYSPDIFPVPLNVMDHPEGVGYVPGISFTWCTELFEKYQPGFAPGVDDLDRLFWLQVAMNARAFNIYNGAALRQATFAAQPSGPSQIYISSSSNTDTQVAYVSGLAADGVTEISETVALTAGTALTANTYSKLKFCKPNVYPSLANNWTFRQGGSSGTFLGVNFGSSDVPSGGHTSANAICGLGDLGLPIGMLGTWNTMWDHTMTNISSFASVILAPGNWTQITTVIPAFVPPNFNFTSTSHTAGMYAAKKFYAGQLYVIAVAMDMQWNPGPATTTENAIPSGTIDVGQPITSCVRLFEGGSPTFSGSQITGEAFRAGQVHVYRVT